MDSEANTILLLGEGNFSFSSALSTLLENKIRIIATDLALNETNIQFKDERDGRIQKATQMAAMIKENISKIPTSNVFLDVDATNLQNHPTLSQYKDSISMIIFNFPHVKRKKNHIELNRNLLRKSFISISEFMAPRQNYVVHISLLAGQSGIGQVEEEDKIWGNTWHLLEMAAHGNFILKEASRFTEFLSKTFSPKLLELYQSAGYRDRSYSSFNFNNANTFTFIPRDPPSHFNLDTRISVEDNQMLFKKYILKHILSFPSDHPLTLLIQKYLKMNLSDIRIDVDSLSGDSSGINSVGHPMISIWVDYMKKEEIVVHLFPFFETLTEVRDCSVPTKTCLKVLDSIVGESEPTTDPNTSVISLNVTNLIALFFQTNGKEDLRSVFSEFCHFNTPKQDKFNGSELFKLPIATGSLYPRTHLSWDISFWTRLPCDCPSLKKHCFNLDTVYKLALMVYGLLLKSIEMKDEYNEPKSCKTIKNFIHCSDCDAECGRVSYCFSIVLQSLDKPLSWYHALHQYHDKFKKVLVSFLGVEYIFI